MILVFLACVGAIGDTGNELCEDAPSVDYVNFGAGFMTENCQSCHASTSADRAEAPESVTFDDVDSCWFFADRIVELAGAEPPGMPPEGGTSEDDRYLLRVWLTCGEEGM